MRKAFPITKRDWYSLATVAQLKPHSARLYRRWVDVIRVTLYDAAVLSEVTKLVGSGGSFPLHVTGSVESLTVIANQNQCGNQQPISKSVPRHHTHGNKKRNKTLHRKNKAEPQEYCRCELGGDCTLDSGCVNVGSQLECTPDYGAGERCNNQRFQNRQYASEAARFQ